MLQFIVLGIVPGTSIQLNFSDYMIGLLSLAFVAACYTYYYNRTMRHIASQAFLSFNAL